MGDSRVFELVSNELERRSSLSRLEARGTVRLALKQAGLAAVTVTPEQMAIVLRRVLPAELATRSVKDPAALCEDVARCLAGVEVDSSRDQTPEAVFARIVPG